MFSYEKLRNFQNHAILHIKVIKINGRSRFNNKELVTFCPIFSFGHFWTSKIQCPKLVKTPVLDGCFGQWLKKSVRNPASTLRPLNKSNLELFEQGICIGRCEQNEIQIQGLNLNAEFWSNFEEEEDGLWR